MKKNGGVRVREYVGVMSILMYDPVNQQCSASSRGVHGESAWASGWRQGNPGEQWAPVSHSIISIVGFFSFFFFKLATSASSATCV